MPSKIILYDLPDRSDPPRCWSLNPWKARAALNYKDIPYTTEWVEYPDLATKLPSLGLPPNGPDGYTDYTAPAARLPDGRYVMDSHAIAVELEKIQPEPSLHLDREDLIDRTRTVVGNAFGALRAIAMPRVPEMLLPPRSAEYFHETRSKRFGMSLEELGKSDKAKSAWENAKEPLQELRKLLTENEGPFVMGKEASFADFVVGGMFAFVKRLDKDGDLYGRMMSTDPSFPAHVEATKKWFEKDT